MEEETFELNGNEFIELYKLLKVTGFCESGGFAKTIISEGYVYVDGVQELRKRCKIRAGQTIDLDGNIIKVKS